MLLILRELRYARNDEENNFVLSVGNFDAATLFMVSRSREEGPQRGKGEKAVFGT